MEQFNIAREVDLEIAGRVKVPRVRRKAEYKILSAVEKTRCLDECAENGVKKTAFKYGVDIQSLLRWMKKGVKRKEGCGRKVYNKEMEIKLKKWYDEKVEKGEPVSSKDIKREAAELSKDPKFKASNGWLEKFKRRNKISLGKKRKPEKETTIELVF